MNHNINIAEILKDYSKGTKLYSPLFGNVTFEKVEVKPLTKLQFAVLVCLGKILTTRQRNTCKKFENF